IRQAQTRSGELRTEFETYPLLNPVLAAIAASKLKAGREQLVQVALGRVAAGTTEADIVPALEAAKAAKERAQLDWGRFSLSPVAKPENHPLLLGLSEIEEAFATFHERLVEAAGKAVESGRPQTEPRLRQFVELGISL